MRPTLATPRLKGTKKVEFIISINIFNLILNTIYETKSTEII